jgi:uncharacterized protein (DUF1697 family)
MPTHIALLRGINVGGKNMLAMADLKKLCTKLKLANPTTLLQSGNLLFDAPATQDLPALELLLEQHTETHHKIAQDYFLRTVAELRSVLTRNPFPAEAQSDPSHLLVMFFKSKPAPKNIQSLQQSIKGRERLSPSGRELYITYPDGIGTSKLTNTLIEKHLALRGTARNWNTLLKLHPVRRPRSVMRHLKKINHRGHREHRDNEKPPSTKYSPSDLPHEWWARQGTN